jgi:LAO/AO transport system kinase
MHARSAATPQDVNTLVGVAARGADVQRTRAAARLMTLLEAEPYRLPELFRALPQAEWPRPRVVFGITGAPGTGKSTLVDALVAELRRREPDGRIGVIAVDPSSPFTGGAVLGDRVRMMRHSTDPLVFIRSLATRGHLGGLSLGVKGVLRVMALMGCDVVLVETVGVGQSEVEVARIADRVGVVLAPGAGDSVQMLKAGLMEVGDVFIVNKADAEGADALRRSLLQTLSLSAGQGHEDAAANAGAAGDADGEEHAHAGSPHDAHAARPAVLLTTASEGRGIAELADWLTQHAHAGATDPLADARADVCEAVFEAARRAVEGRLAAEPQLLDDVIAGSVTITDVVQRLFAAHLNR